jgi:hypothetical protein
MESFQKDRNITEIPIHPTYEKKTDGHLEWYNHLNSIYFFKNQNELFDCFFIILNKKIYISYNVRNNLSIDFMKFVKITAPTNIKDKKRRIYKPTKLM